MRSVRELRDAVWRELGPDTASDLAKIGIAAFCTADDIHNDGLASQSALQQSIRSELGDEAAS